MLGGDRNGTSSCELSRKLGVTQKTAWFMFHRIRLAMQDGAFKKLSGSVEIDEAYIGGKAKSTDVNPETGKLMPTGPQEGKAIVVGMVERNGCVRVAKVPNVQRKTLNPIIEKNVTPGATVYTDALSTYGNLDKAFEHHIINHSIEYVRGKIHTNTIENFWSCLKRTINGTYTFVSVEHLERYLDEQMFRHNARDKEDSNRLKIAVRGVAGKRIMYKQLTATTSAKRIATRSKQRIAAIKWRAMKAKRIVTSGDSSL
jgi:transposase-like protein